MRAAHSWVPALLGLALVAGCSAPELDPNDPGSVAQHLFTLATDGPAQEELATIFDPEVLPEHPVALLDALDAIADLEDPELLAVDSSPDTDEVFVDLALALPGEGRAVYSVKLRHLEQAGWRIAWFQGPGVEWPDRGRRGPGLSTSAPPEPATDGW